MAPTRRALLASGAGAALAGPAWADDALPSLKAAAVQAGLQFGSDSDVTITTAPPVYAGLLAQHCNLFAPSLSWSRVEPKQGQTLAEDPNVGFARAHAMRLTGAHLLWHLRTPDWVAALDGPAMQAAVDRHIQQMVGRYAGQTWSWNVVNEEIDTRNGDPYGMRLDLFAARLGPDWMARAFKTARAADPRALLLYNDAQFEMADALSTVRRDALLRLLDRLQRAGAPINGVGTQSHLRLDNVPFDPAVFRRFLHEIASRGLVVVISEMDVFDYAVGPDFATRDAAVAARYRAFLEVALDEPAVKAVVLWGLSDRYTWITPDRDGPYARPDRLPARPLPFDDQFRPKPAFYAVLDALKAAPKRRPA